MATKVSRIQLPEESSTPRFLAIGHRGAKGHAPENTLLSFATAINLGAHMIELDVQRLGDSLLVLHDCRLERTTNGKGRLQDQDLLSVRNLDAGRGERIPTLEEVINLVDRRVPINIEIKSGGGTTELLITLLQRFLDAGWAAEDFLVSSFLHTELARFAKALPQIRIGVLIGGVPTNLAQAAEDLGAWSLHLEADFADPQMLADARRRGLKVFVHTVNQREEIEFWRGAGIAGVFTDYPERAVFLESAA